MGGLPIKKFDILAARILALGMIIGIPFFLFATGMTILYEFGIYSGFLVSANWVLGAILFFVLCARIKVVDIRNTKTLVKWMEFRYWISTVKDDD